MKQLLEQLCKRLSDEAKGLRKCIFWCYRVDSHIQKIEIGTTRPSRNVAHLFKLFEHKIVQIAPALGIELFVLDAPVVEDLTAKEDALWQNRDSNDNAAVAELLDRIAGKLGEQAIVRFLPAEYHWPEHSVKRANH